MMKIQRLFAKNDYSITKGKRVGTSLLLGGTTGLYAGMKLGEKVGGKIDDKREEKRKKSNKELLIKNLDEIKDQEGKSADWWNDIYRGKEARGQYDDVYEYAKNAATGHKKYKQLLEDGKLDEYLDGKNETGYGLADVEKEISKHKDYKKESYKSSKVTAGTVGGAIGATTGTILVNKGLKKLLK